MNVLLQSPNTHKIITLPPSLTEASPSILHRYMECYPPTLPSDASWDILFPVPEESTIVTFTRPPLAERSNLRKAALVKTRQELVDRDASAASYEERLRLLEQKTRESDEQKTREINAIKLSQQLLVQREFLRHMHLLRFEIYSRLLQVLNDDLMSNLNAQVKLQMKKIDLGYITSILEGVFPHGSKASPRDQLLCLGDQPILPTFPDPTKRMKLSHEALNTMPDERCGWRSSCIVSSMNSEMVISRCSKLRGINFSIHDHPPI